MKKFISEFIGTFILVFVGTGAIISNDLSNGSITHIGICLTFGLVVAVLVCTFGNISGTHINPAVSLGFYLKGLLTRKELVYYICAQCLGGIAGSLALKLLLPLQSNYGATLPSINLIGAFTLEVFLSCLLMFTIIQVAIYNKQSLYEIAIIVGALIALEALFAGPLTGASMNPARSLGPALISGNLKEIWLYLTAPLIGSGLAVLFSKLINPTDNSKSTVIEKPSTKDERILQSV